VRTANNEDCKQIGIANEATLNKSTAIAVHATSFSSFSVTHLVVYPSKGSFIETRGKKCGKKTNIYASKDRASSCVQIKTWVGNDDNGDTRSLPWLSV